MLDMINCNCFHVLPRQFCVPLLFATLEIVLTILNSTCELNPIVNWISWICIGMGFAYHNINDVI